MRDLDDFYINYQDLVDSGDIDPSSMSIDQYVEDRISELIDRAEMFYNPER